MPRVALERDHGANHAALEAGMENSIVDISIGAPDQRYLVPLHRAHFYFAPNFIADAKSWQRVFSELVQHHLPSGIIAHIEAPYADDYELKVTLRRRFTWTINAASGRFDLEYRSTLNCDDDAPDLASYLWWTGRPTEFLRQIDAALPADSRDWRRGVGGNFNRQLYRRRLTLRNDLVIRELQRLSPLFEGVYGFMRQRLQSAFRSGIAVVWAGVDGPARPEQILWTALKSYRLVVHGCDCDDPYHTCEHPVNGVAREPNARGDHERLFGISVAPAGKEHFAKTDAADVAKTGEERFAEWIEELGLSHPNCAPLSKDEIIRSGVVKFGLSDRKAGFIRSQRMPPSWGKPGRRKENKSERKSPIKN